MSSRPLLNTLSAPAEADIARALPRNGQLGFRYRTVTAAGGRRLAMCAVHHAADAAELQAFAASVARRGDARSNRLLPVVSAGSREDWHWVAYECGAAVPLSAENRHRWRAPSALGLIRDLAETLDELAAQGVAPYELSPGSIFLEPRIGALLGDLGAAREAFGDRLAESGHGSAFVPPEVLAGEPAGPGASVYSAGALLHALLAGEPPGSHPLTHYRPDLPSEIDAVLARALARDPLERYDTVVELCENARHALASPVSVQPPSAMPPKRRSRRRPLRAALVVAAVTAGGFAGLQFGAPNAPATDAGAELTGKGLSMTVPSGWIPGVTRGSVVLAAYPNSDWLSGISARLDSKGFVPDDRSDPVRLGELDAWRDRTDYPAAIRYVVPTSAGTLVISCDASSGAPARVLRLCEQAASTLRLEDFSALPLPGVVERPGIRAAVAGLRTQRAVGRRRLARARAPGVQRLTAAGLARAYGRAARRLDAVPDGAALAGATRRAAVGYAAMAQAARRSDRRRWNAARADVRRSEAALARLLRADG